MDVSMTDLLLSLLQVYPFEMDASYEQDRSLEEWQQLLWDEIRDIQHARTEHAGPAAAAAAAAAEVQVEQVQAEAE
jgi:hypothetical protein